MAGALKAHGWGSPVTSSTMPASKGQRAADRAAVYIAQVRQLRRARESSPSRPWPLGDVSR